MCADWSKSAWRARPRIQMPDYPDAGGAGRGRGASSPPIRRWSSPARRRKLKAQLAEVAEGRAFLLQGGDCAESFAEFSADNIRDTFKVMLQMAVVLTFGAKCPVVKIGRMAGQFAKPRSAPTETVGGRRAAVLPRRHRQRLRVHRRRRGCPIPARMLQAYLQSAATLNLLRAFSQGGYADITRVHSWTLDFTAGQAGLRAVPQARQPHLRRARLHAARPASSPETADTLHRVDFYTSHEALLLEYEEALCRIDSTTGLPVAGSGHMIWIGDRTRQPDGAHVEFARGVQNPIGLKCGPSITESDLLKLIDRLNPKNEAGRLTLICRFGAGAGGRAPAAADPGGRARGAEGGLVLRPDARQHHQVGDAATRPGRSSGCCARCASSSRSTPPRAPSRAACISR